MSTSEAWNRLAFNYQDGRLQPNQTWNTMVYPFMANLGPPAPPSIASIWDSVSGPGRPRMIQEALDYLSQRSHQRTVSFGPSQNTSGTASTDPTEVGEMTAADNAAHDRRVLELDSVSGFLQRICLPPGRWLPFIPEHIPMDRRNNATPEALVLWRDIADNIFVPHDRDFEPIMGQNVGIRLMASMWDDLVNIVFAGLFKHIPGQPRPIPLVDRRPPTEEAHIWVANKLIRRYNIFEKFPMNPECHRAHVFRVHKLAEAALALRDILTVENNPTFGDPLFTYEIYTPRQLRSSDVRSPFLENQNRRAAHIENYDLTHTEDTKPTLAMTLCGGLIRRPRAIIRDEYGENSRQLRTTIVYERKAAVATVASVRDQLTKIRHFLEGSNHEVVMERNTYMAGTLARDLSRDQVSLY